MKLTDEMVEAALRVFVGREWSSLDAEAMRLALEAALSAAPPAVDAAREVVAPAGEADAVVAWQTIETAPKDGAPILLCLKDPIPNGREDLRRWDGLQFVARHPGLADDGFDVGWCFAAPVGQGGFPDEWIAGWRPLPVAAIRARGER